MLSHENTTDALHKLHQTYQELKSFFSDRKVENFENDICRRNLMMSAFHESYFTEAFKAQYGSACNDGRTGKADIIITALDREVECKLTSVAPSGGFNLQTDYRTLEAKGSLDYLYILTDREFEKFAALYFSQLSVNDFHKPSLSSRGKAKMKKSAGFKKLSVLFGQVENRKEQNLAKAQQKLANCSSRAVKKKQKLQKSIEYWQSADDSYRIIPAKLTPPSPFA